MRCRFEDWKSVRLLKDADPRIYLALVKIDCDRDEFSLGVMLHDFPSVLDVRGVERQAGTENQRLVASRA